MSILRCMNDCMLDPSFARKVETELQMTNNLIEANELLDWQTNGRDRSESYPPIERHVWLEFAVTIILNLAR